MPVSAASPGDIRRHAITPPYFVMTPRLGLPMCDACPYLGSHGGLAIARALDHRSDAVGHFGIDVTG